MRPGRLVAGTVLHAAALLSVYMVTGPFRTILLDTRLGPLGGAAVEAAAFAVTSLASVALVLGRLDTRWSVPDALAVGPGALLLLAAADAAIAVGLCGVPLGVHFGRFATVPGMLQAGAVLIHGGAPALWLAETRQVSDAPARSWRARTWYRSLVRDPVLRKAP